MDADIVNGRSALWSSSGMGVVATPRLPLSLLGREDRLPCRLVSPRPRFEARGDVGLEELGDAERGGVDAIANYYICRRFVELVK